MAHKLYAAKPSFLGMFSESLSIKVEDSPYGHCDAAQVVGTEVYLILGDNVDYVDETFFKGYVFKREKDGKSFFKFVDDWLHGGVAWYRGFGIAHFSYPGLLNDGQLRSEGDADVPKSTMSDKATEAKTRWLPGFPYDPDPCVNAACGIDYCPYTSALLGEGREMPLGLVVHSRLGYAYCPRPVAWLYDGEAVVQGPLVYIRDFEVVKIGGFFGGGLNSPNVPPNLPRADLPPPRPYHKVSSSEGVRDWYDNQCVPWLNRVNVAGDTLTIQQGIPNAFAGANVPTGNGNNDI
jgi:hypothetical protein